jgi:rhamnulokinase
MKVTAGPVEATAIGNIMLQAYGAGLYRSLPEVRRVVRNSFAVKDYLPVEREVWEQAYARFIKVIEAEGQGESRRARLTGSNLCRSAAGF